MPSFAARANFSCTDPFPAVCVIRQACFINRKVASQLSHLFPDTLFNRAVADMLQHVRNPSPTFCISGSRKPRVVTEGLPRRIPPPFMGGKGSKGIEFLFTVMPARSRAFSASVPVTLRECTSTRNKWLSVPPVTIRNPRSAIASAIALAFA